AYPHVRDYLSIWQLDDKGLVVHRKGDWDWADWGKDIDSRVLDQAWYCLALESAANIARLAGKPNEAADYESKQSAVIAATNEALWNGTAYRTPDYQGETDERGNALCVVAGIAGRDKFPAITNVLTAVFH